jgi:MFS family permease
VTPSPLRRALRPDWLPRDVQLLIIARTTMSGARALLAVTVPIYLAELGFSATRLGALFTVTAITAAALTACVGLLSDRFGRKVFVVGLPLLTALAAALFAVSRADALLFACAAAGSFGRGSGAGAGQVGPYSPAEQAMVADAIPRQHRNAIFGRLAFASALGALFGNGLASLPDLMEHFGRAGAAAYRPAFLVAAVCALVAGLVALPIADTRAPKRSAPLVESGERRRVRLPLSRDSRAFLMKLWLTNSVNGLATGLFGPFITYWFYRRYGVSSGTIGALYAAINVVSMFSVLSAAGVARRVGLVRAVTFSRVCQGSLLIPMALAPTFWVAGGIYMLRMTLQRIGMPLRQSYVMAMVPSEERGTVAGLSQLPSQATSTSGPVIAGYMFEHISLALPFMLGGVLQLVTSALFYHFFAHLPPPEEAEAQAQVQAASHARELTAASTRQEPELADDG